MLTLDLMSHRGTEPAVIEPIEMFDDDDCIWILNCTCCERIFANVRLSTARGRWADAHNAERFIDPMRRLIDLND